jgi:glycolate oxidase FAD binding subunit
MEGRAGCPARGSERRLASLDRQPRLRLTRDDPREAGTPLVTAAITPPTVADVADTVRDAAARRMSLRIAGRATWLDAGRPVHASATLSVAALTGVVEYTPGDLTLTARAGTTLAELREVTAREGQWLTLDPHGSDAGSLGATIATASAGPLSGAYGLPRDLVLGVEFVTGTGEITRGGGRVVKNVAGFDLTRLVTGAWGTLGILTEVTVRLRARPACDRTLAAAIGSGEASLGAIAKRLRGAPLSPSALEALNAPLSAQLGLGSHPVLLVRLSGNDDAVQAQHDALAAVTELATVSSEVWDRLRGCEPTRGPCSVLRLSQRPSRIGETWEVAVAAARATGGYVHASLVRGVARCILPTREPAAIEEALGTVPAVVVRLGERLPADLWPPDAVSERLSRGVRNAFDPQGVLNPGILGGDP